MKRTRLQLAITLGLVLAGASGGNASPADPFPDAGQDRFYSIFTHQAIEITANPLGLPVGYLPDVDFRGPTVVDRGDPILGTDNRYQIPTEMVSMELTGSFGVINATIHESPTQASTGLVREVTPSDAPGHYIPRSARTSGPIRSPRSPTHLASSPTSTPASPRTATSTR